nr:hypothetical protein BgiMline_018493 [Biomphalaria glabrata]
MSNSVKGRPISDDAKQLGSKETYEKTKSYKSKRTIVIQVCTDRPTGVYHFVVVPISQETRGERLSLVSI